MKQGLGSLILASLFLPSQGRFLGFGSSQSEEGLGRGLQAAQCPNPDEYPQPPGAPEGCSRSPWNFTFTEGVGTWDGNLGARAAVNTASGIDGEYLTISNRKANWQGPKLEVTDAIRGCVDSSVMYFFSVDFRLSKAGGTSDCSASGSSCPRLMWNHMNSEEAPRAWNLTHFDPLKYTNDGEWIHWAATIEIDETYVDPTDVFAAVMILGMEADVTIDIDNFMISMPPEPPAPGPFDVCAELFENGDGASSSGGVYPWKPLIGLDEITLHDNPNGGFYFSMKDRAQPHSSPVQELIPGCLRDGAKYKLSAMLRVHNPSPSHVYVMVRSGTPPNIKFLPMGRCTSANGDDFFLCEKEFSRTLGNLPEAPFVIIYTTANLNPKPDMDFANMTLTPLSCGVDSGGGEGEGTPTGTGGTGTEVGDNSCTRGVTVRVDAQYQPAEALTVTDGSSSIDVTGSFDSVDDKGDTHWYLAFRKYTMQIGDGDWTAEFTEWPAYAEVILDDPPESCNNFMDSFTVTPPAVQNDTCNQLIRNGDFEETTDVTSSQWYHTGCGFTIVAGGVTGNALQTTERTHTANGPVQFLDTRCFSTLNSRYKITAKVKFVDPAYSCTLGPQNPGNGRCVRANIRSLSNGVNPQYEYSVGDTVGNTAGEWNTLEGYFSVSAEMVAADNIALYFDGPDVSKEFMIDDVTVTKEEASAQQCVTNGDIAGGALTNWNKYGADTVLSAISPGADGSGFAIQAAGRSNINSGPANELNPDCFTAGQVLEISGKIKLKNGASAFSCNPYQMYTLPDYCPDIYLSSNKLGLSAVNAKVAHTVGPYDGSGWNSIYGTFTVTEEIASWASVNAFVGRVKAGITEIVDDLSIKPADANTVGIPDCNQLIKNGDGEVGDARFWYLKTGSNHGTIKMVSTSSETGNGDWAFHHDGTGRTNVAQGMLQTLDTSCMSLNSKWKVTAKFRMYDSTGTQVSCTPGGTCAKFLFQAHGTGQTLANQLTITGTGNWPATGWGVFESTFTYDSNMFGKDNLDFFVHTVQLGWSYDLDDVSIVPQLS